MAVLAWVALVPGDASAALPPGAPKLRQARVADIRAQPRADQELWELRMFDPHSTAMVFVSFRRMAGNASGFSVRGLAGEMMLTEASGGGEPTATRDGVTVGMNRTRLGARGAAVSLQADHLDGHVSVSRTRRGPAAIDFALGLGNKYDGPAPATLNWSMPIAYGVAHGTVDLWDRHIDVGGWLVSYAHTWGDGIYDDTAYTHWDNWLVQRGGSTWIAFGLNRRDTITGPGAREAMWLGLLARVGRRTTTICRPRVERRRWILPIDPLEKSIAHRMRASCRGLRATFTDGLTQSAIDTPNLPGLVGLARVSGDGRGWVVHRN
jgi:hypothetical protein